jgi:hypothetical protein
VASNYAIREAVRADVDLLVAFTRQEAEQAEGKTIDIDAIRRGVLGGFDDPPRATYWWRRTPSWRERCGRLDDADRGDTRGMGERRGVRAVRRPMESTRRP